MQLGITAFLTDRSMAPADLAIAAEERGFASLFVPEHTHLPVRADTPPSVVDGVHLDDYRRSLDPFVALATAAAVTDRLILGTGVILVAQHDPIVLAKQAATLDHLSGGRTRLGVGFGWNRAEASDHGVDFARRWAIVSEHIRCMQALWSMEQAEFHGDFITLEPCWSWPKPVQRPGIPVLVGGGATDRVFAAVAEYGDGWMPIGGAGISKALPALRRAVEDKGRDPDGIAVIPFGTVPTVGKLDRYQSLGITAVVLRIPSGPAQEMLDALDRYAVLVEQFAGDG